jgi:diacylglycerol O-acyltransferase / wax synthase
VDRLTAQDLMMLWPEELGWSQDIGALAILDGASLLDADGRFRIETAREEIGRRLHWVPRFRQLLYRPRFGLGWPLWVDAASIDLSEHVRVFPLAAPADEAQLLAACEELRHRRLCRSRPLWGDVVPARAARRSGRSLHEAASCDGRRRGRDHRPRRVRRSCS